ncbi:hypothetical protein ASF61_19210 [Duganella sp. Leaf126]|uniref:hypothetical protein n=1 Tax=Duganella sp. Leaf126 TaxID=1736266 RepID=UPI000700D884|nr:hypothetical protein [Duganella sp. Leaf126]KQQ45788.1 hypothetical protein ASF61_19210 [Duganella sp. Leaf126]
MNHAGKPSNPDHDAAPDGGHLTEEADIGSGEPSPGKQETDEAIKSIPPLPKDGGQRPDAG